MELFDQANALHESGRYAEAEQCYDLLLAQNPDNPGLLATVGTLNLRMGRYGLAISLLHRAAEKLPQSDVLCNLAVGYKYSGQYDKAHEWFRKATEVDPTADALANYSALFVNVGTPEEAIKQAKRALDLDSQCAMAHWNTAIAQLELSMWETAWDEHEWGFKSKMRIDRKIANKPYWDGTPGKTVAVYGEQGLGDEIMFASMLPDMMRENKVIYESHPRLKTLFEKSFPGLEIHGTREQKEADWHNARDIDYQCSIGSLGRWYRRSKESFPGTAYLKAESAPMGNKFRVGISWTGGMKEGRVRTRSIPLSWWKTVLNNDCEFISLQYTDCADELAVLSSKGYDIAQFPEITDKDSDYYETAKLVRSCDLVISVCTSVIHLAGALGVPCWVMVPKRAAWRYGVAGPMRWYRSVRLYRQPNADQAAWVPVVQKVGLDLEDLLRTNERKVAYG